MPVRELDGRMNAALETEVRIFCSFSVSVLCGETVAWKLAARRQT